MNPFFNAMNRGQTIMGMLQSFRQNPMQMFIQRGLNVPQNIANNPAAVMQHLLSTGQISQSQVDNAYQMARQMGMK